MKLFEQVIVPITLVVVGLYVAFTLGEFITTGSLADERSIDYGDQVTETFDLDDFNSIDYDISGELLIEKGDTNQLVIDGPERLIDDLRVDVRDNELLVRRRTRFFFFTFWTPTQVEAILTTTQDLNSLDFSGGVEVRGDDVLAEEISISANGSVEGDLSGINSQDLDITINGSGDITLSGESENARFDINGSGNINGFDLETEDTITEINGSGDVKISVSNNLDVEINGSGDVTYRGDPDIDSNINGSGDVNKE